MKLALIAVLSALLTLSVKADHHHFIIDYLRCKNMYAATFLICGSNRGTVRTVNIKTNTKWLFSESVETFKAMNRAKIFVNIFTPNHCLRTNTCSLKDVSIRTMLILDIACEGSLRLFKQVINTILYSIFCIIFLASSNRNIDTGTNGCFWT